MQAHQFQGALLPAQAHQALALEHLPSKAMPTCERSRVLVQRAVPLPKQQRCQAFTSSVTRSESAGQHWCSALSNLSGSATVRLSLDMQADAA